MTHPPDATIIFLFTDIEGSTSLWEKHRESMQVSLERHDDIVRGAIERREGHVFKTMGDAFCAAFSTASRAAAAAVDIQMALREESWAVPGGIRVRVALHAGEAAQRDSDYFGPTVNRVARLLSAAHGGQTILSSVAAELVGDSLPAGVSLLSLGSHRLKDLDRPLTIFQLQHEDSSAEFPALVTLDSHPNNLTSPATPFFGREADQSDLADLILREDVRIVTLTGPGGIGKSRLALQVAAQLLDQFEHGAYFVDLSSVTDPEQVAATILNNLDVSRSADDTRPDLSVLTDFLLRKKLLLVLDNFEQIIAAAPCVSQIVGATDHVKIIITSREPLHLRGEHEFAVLSLALPGSDPDQSVESMTQYDAVHLFIERALLVRSDFRVTNENAPTVAEICIRLDGLPLAIELAAARLKVLSPQALLRHMDDRLKLLKGGARDLPSRQQTISGAIDWSYNLLEEDEKLLFRRLSVFPGGATIDAAEAVCVDEGESGVDLLDGLTSLVDKSLLLSPAGNAEPRFAMLGIIHEYAYDLLLSSGEGDTLNDRMADFLTALAKEAEPALFGPDQEGWFARLDDEHANLHRTLDWFSRQERITEGLELVGNLGWYWWRRGRFTTGQAWLETFLSDSDPSQRERAKALYYLGWLKLVQSGFTGTDSRECFVESLALYRESGERKNIALAQSMVGFWEQQAGDVDAGRAQSDEGVDLARETGERWMIAFSLRMAYSGNRREDIEPNRLKSLLQEAVELAEETGDPYILCSCVHGMGDVRRYLGEYRGALTLFRASLEISRKIKDGFYVFHNLREIGMMHALLGESGQAKSCFREGLQLASDMGSLAYIQIFLSFLGYVAIEEGHEIRAAQLFGAAGVNRRGDRDLKNANPFQSTSSTAIRVSLDEEEYQTAWTYGHTLPRDEAIAVGIATWESNV